MISRQDKKRYWQLTIQVESNKRSLRFTRNFQQKEEAEKAYRRINLAKTAKVVTGRRERSTEQAPLLYNLSALQEDAYNCYDYSPHKTLEIITSLHKAELISNPYTKSCFISDETFSEIPSLIRKLLKHPLFRIPVLQMDMRKLSKKPIHRKKTERMGDALLITQTVPETLNEEEGKIYSLIAGRMLEAFSLPQKQEKIHIYLECRGIAFQLNETRIIQGGWTNVFKREAQEKRTSLLSELKLTDFKSENQLLVTAFNLVEFRTKSAKPSRESISFN